MTAVASPCIFPSPGCESAYSPALYDALPSLFNARKAVEQKVTERDFQDIGSIFVRHNLHENFGVSLQHRHLSMLASERMVEQVMAKAESDKSKIVSKSRPRAIADLEKSGVGVQAHTWSVSTDGALYPLEFEEVTGDVAAASPSFCAELAALLKSKGLLDILALTRLHRYEGDDNSELFEYTDSKNRLNIIKIGSPQDLVSATPAVWRFAASESADGPPIIQLRCHCRCDNGTMSIGPDGKKVFDDGHGHSCG